ncbi:MAG: histone deacetylase [Deltaproteobacteria bacterium]|nr:histone deacetylase [Deltaproteobacteria bacterium]
MLLKTGIVKDYTYLEHDPGSFHPETPRRLQAIYEILESRDMKGNYVAIKPRSASYREIAMNHGETYIDLVAATSGKRYYSLDPDTQTSARSYETALLAAGGVCNAIDSVIEGKVDNAFALVRPPGHHAEYGSGAGFCIFNNIAIGARHAMKKHGMKRVLIVDWDLHHGNGTQHSFYNEKGVLYFSTHQSPFYPGTGGIDETGRGEGLGYTINVPLRSGPGDAEFVRIFKKILEPVAERFEPEIILLSAGFDIYKKDSMGGMNLSTSGFANLTRILMNIAETYCGSRFIATLEGGYNIDGQAQSVKAVLKEMRGETCVSESYLERIESGSGRSLERIIERVIDQIEPIWHVF